MEWGRADAGPPLLLLHGLSSNALFWSRIARELADRRVIAVDQRGHGRTGAASDYAVEELVADAAAVLDDARVERALVVGHSWGASVALAAAGTRPDRCAGLVFADGPLWSIKESVPWEEFSARTQPPFPRWSRREEAVVDLRDALGGSWAEDLLPFAHNGVTRDGDEWRPVLTHDVRATILRHFYEQDAAELWRAVSGPVLVAIASRKPRQMLERMEHGLDRVRRIVPRAVVRRYDSPHDIPLYRPAELAADIRQTLALAERA